MALTLLDIARQKKDDFDAGVVEAFTMECDISRKLPLQTINTTEVQNRRTNSVPTVGFRKRGEAFGEVKGGLMDDVADAVYPMGGTIKIDKMDWRDKKLVGNVMMDRIKLAVKGMSWKFNELFINGDHGVDEDEFEGIKVRLAASQKSKQTVYGNSASASLDIAAALAANTTATLQTFLDRIDDAIYECDGHKADICLTNADGIKAIKATLRRLSLYKDAEPVDPPTFGSGQRRTGSTNYQAAVWRYNDVDFIDMGKDHNQVNPIVGTETFGSDACRPFYFLKFGHPYVYGIQQYPMETSKPKLLDDDVTIQVTIDWPVGLHQAHPESMAKLAGVKVAA